MNLPLVALRLCALASLDAQRHALAVDAADLEADHLAGAQARTVATDNAV